MMPVDERLMDRKCEYLLESRTERYIAGYDGEHTVIRCKGIAMAVVLCETGNVSYL